MTSHAPAHALQAVLDGLPERSTPRDRRARGALRAALDALQEGKSEQEALDAVALFYAQRSPLPPPLPFLPQKVRP